MHDFPTHLCPCPFCRDRRQAAHAESLRGPPDVGFTAGEPFHAVDIDMGPSYSDDHPHWCREPGPPDIEPTYVIPNFSKPPQDMTPEELDAEMRFYSLATVRRLADTQRGEPGAAAARELGRRAAGESKREAPADAQPNVHSRYAALPDPSRTPLQRALDAVPDHLDPMSTSEPPRWHQGKHAMDKWPPVGDVELTKRKRSLMLVGVVFALCVVVLLAAGCASRQDAYWAQVTPRVGAVLQR